jgi:uncharacterized metal-binding protein YceD (DUF177 family)
MIAAAMNTRPQEGLSYRDLARQQARICRQIDLGTLDRLKGLVGQESPEFEVTLQFSMDSRGLCRVDGTVRGEITLSCHGCAESLVHSLSLSFGCLIAESEAMADRLTEGEEVPPADVLVAEGTEISIGQIVEDEILLSLPERLCTSSPCERAPSLSYPAVSTGSDGEAAGEDSGEESPFSVLRALKHET